MKAQSNEKKLPNTTLVPKTNASDERERERELASQRERESERASQRERGSKLL